ADLDVHAWGDAGADTGGSSWYSQNDDMGTSGACRRLGPSDNSVVDTASTSFDAGKSAAVSDVRRVESGHKSRNPKTTPGLRILKHEVATIKSGKTWKKLELDRTPAQVHPSNRLSAERSPPPPSSLEESTAPTPLASSID